jgi:hypothetical protein
VKRTDCIEGLETRSGRLMASCHTVVDRTGHSVWWITDDAPRLLMTSIESDAHEAWPESSPLQQIVCESVGAGGKPVLLGVGMAGKAHWSATIEGDSLTEAIAFDMACRTAAAPLRLGSKYKIADGWIVRVESDRTLRLQDNDGNQLAIDSIGNLPIQCNDRSVLIHPIIDPAQHQRGQTYRWRYVLRAVDT